MIGGQEFRELASVISSLAPELMNIGLATDFVIRHIYPLQDNEAAISLDLAGHLPIFEQASGEFWDVVSVNWICRTCTRR